MISLQVETPIVKTKLTIDRCTEGDWKSLCWPEYGFRLLGPIDLKQIYAICTGRTLGTFDYALPQAWRDEHPDVVFAVWEYPNGSIFGTPIAMDAMIKTILPRELIWHLAVAAQPEAKWLIDIMIRNPQVVLSKAQASRILTQAGLPEPLLQ